MDTKYLGNPLIVGKNKAVAFGFISSDGKEIGKLEG